VRIEGFSSSGSRSDLSRTTINDFGMDVEVLFIAQHLGYRIQRCPGTLTGFRGDSRVHLLKDSANMFWELLLIRWKALRGTYQLK
jgi:hypothetical protein